MVNLVTSDCGLNSAGEEAATPLPPAKTLAI